MYEVYYTRLDFNGDFEQFTGVYNSLDAATAAMNYLCGKCGYLAVQEFDS